MKLRSPKSEVDLFDLDCAMGKSFLQLFDKTVHDGSGPLADDSCNLSVANVNMSVPPILGDKERQDSTIGAGERLIRIIDLVIWPFLLIAKALGDEFFEIQRCSDFLGDRAELCDLLGTQRLFVRIDNLRP